MSDTIGRFVLRALAWVPPCFAVWYFAGPVVVQPAWWLTRLVARTALGRLFSDVERDGISMTFVTTLRPGQATTLAPASGIVTFDVNALIYTYGVPLIVALTLAARQPGKWPRLAVALAALVPFQAWGALSDALQTVAVGLGPAVASQTGFSPLQREAVVFAYQFGHLVLPAVAPAVAWVVAQRQYLQRLAALPAGR
jgi:hypothetical protein